MEHPVRLFVDGGVIEGEGVYWSVAWDRASGVEKWADRQRDRQYTTNNEAEYLALLCALWHLHKRPHLKSNRVLIHSDSQLVVQQFNGKWKVRDPRMQSLHAKATNLACALAEVGFNIELRWVRRDENVKRLGH